MADEVEVVFLKLSRGVDCGRWDIDAAERDGPSFDATRADLSRKRLYSYFATNVSG